MITSVPLKVVHLGEEMPTREKFVAPKTEVHSLNDKPKGGLWTCPADSEYRWLHWCLDEYPEWAEGVTEHELTVSVGTRIFVIDGMDDLMKFISRYEGPWPEDWNEYLRQRFFIIDWERVMQDWDAIWLTEEGQWRTRLTDPNLYGWDLESLLFLNWRFD